MRHHALTNEIGVDEDIATDPVLFVRAPDPKNDSWNRSGCKNGTMDIK